MAPRRSGLYSLLNDGSSEYDMMSESDAHSGNTSDAPASTPPSRSHSRVASDSPNRLRSLTSITTGAYPHPDPMEASPQSRYHSGVGQPYQPYGAGHPGYSSPRGIGHAERGTPGGYHHVVHPGVGMSGAMMAGEAGLPAGMASLNKPVEDMFLVRIDTYTASKEAGDKRQKNADASARYRRRKADQAAEEKSKMAQLQEENRYLGGRVIDLTRQREFYRTERQALRELMLTVPELQEVAKNRPPTPLAPCED